MSCWTLNDEGMEMEKKMDLVINIENSIIRKTISQFNFLDNLELKKSF